MMTTMTDQGAPDQRAVAAHHEAGHAVAAVMRGGSTLTSVTLHADSHGEGIAWANHKPADLGFFSYAGPWAKARLGWPDGVPLDGEDDEWLTFPDHVFGVLMQQPGDASGVDAHILEVRKLSEQVGRDVPTSLALWDHELERTWPANQQVAAWLLDGRTVTDADVRALVDGE